MLRRRQVHTHTDAGRKRRDGVLSAVSKEHDFLSKIFYKSPHVNSFRLPAPQKAAQFTTTHWSVVFAAAQEAAPAAQEALECLGKAYWPPVNSYIRGLGHPPADADDLTQQFFARFLGGKRYKLADRQRGRFRSFVLTSVKHLLVNEWERGSAQKRGGGVRPISLDAPLPGQDDRRPDFPDNQTAARIYEYKWALAVLDEVRARLALEYAETGKAAVFVLLENFLPGGDGGSAHADAAAQLGVAEGTVKSYLHRLRQRYRQLLRDEIARTVETPEEIDDELRHLMSVLSRPRP
jgi:DNA-directed RNA polymerase specialized sigma24 family protein